MMQKPVLFGFGLQVLICFSAAADLLKYTKCVSDSPNARQLLAGLAR